MAFEVELSERAGRDFENAFRYIADRAPQNAKRWRTRMGQAFSQLASLAGSLGEAPESRDTQVQIRQMLVGSYRILYTIRGDVAFVLTIRHAAMQFLPADELSRMTDDA
ncbi:MAG: type II toxin-antitoxin system RelE/ParE family toxin [Planctomycetaceae bacterium]